MSAIQMHQVAEPYIRRRAIRHLEKGRIVIFAAGTSNPYFSTDTAATLRALEIKAQVIAKATKVDGVYDKDPMKHADAVMYRHIGYTEVLTKSLGVMDATSIAMCRDNRLPILVFNLNTPRQYNANGDRRSQSAPSSAETTMNTVNGNRSQREAAHGKGAERSAARHGRHPHRPRLRPSARQHPRRLLRHAHAASIRWRTCTCPSRA